MLDYLVKNKDFFNMVKAALTGENDAKLVTVLLDGIQQALWYPS